MSDSDKDTGSDAAENALDLSALTPRDLMAGWVSDLESPQSFPKDKYRDERGGDDRGGKGRGRGGGGFGGGGGRGRDVRGGGGGGGRGRDDRGGGGGGGRGNFKGGGKGQGRGQGQGQGQGQGRGGRDGGDRRFQGPPPDPAPQFAVSVEPSQETVEALAKHFRTTGRAYSMFDVARNVMAERERYQVAFQGKLPPAKKKTAPQGGDGEGAPAATATPAAEVVPENKPEAAKLVRCKIDGSLWLTRDEAVRHVLSSPELLGEFYIVEEVSVDPPKGNFSSIAVCGMGGTLLGPPNHHEYQTNLAKLHRERFSNMSFERFKQRVMMKNDEETIEAWKDSVSVAKHYRVKPKEKKIEKEEPNADAVQAEESPVDSPAEPKAEVAEASAAESSDSAAQPEPSAEPEAVVKAESDAVASEEASAELVVEPDAAEAEAEAKTGTPESEPAAAEEDSPVEAEAEGENSDADSSADADSDVQAELAVAEEAEPEVVLSNDRELEMHFRENFADKVLRWAGGGVVAGDVPGRSLSPALLEKLKIETERMRRGFPLPLIQTLCRRLEKLGVKFFKRDKKELYASVARPRAIKDESGMTDRLRSIVEFVRAYPKTKVPKLLESLIEGFIAPRNEEEMAGHNPSDDEMSMLRDIRWLTMEGYLIEYANGDLVLGHDEPVHKGSGGGEVGNKAKTKGRQGDGEKRIEPSKKAASPSSDDAAPVEAKQSEPEPVAETKAESPDMPPEPAVPEGEADEGSQMPAPEVADASSADTPPEPKAEPDQEV